MSLTSYWSPAHSLANPARPGRDRETSVTLIDNVTWGKRIKEFIVTFHLNVELPQLALQLTLQHTHVLRRIKWDSSFTHVLLLITHDVALLLCLFHVSYLCVLFISFIGLC